MPSSDHDHPHIINRNARCGLILFAIYVVLYGGFMLLSVAWPQVLGYHAIAGVNVAIVYGVGLIVAALVLAIVYMSLCRSK